MPEDIEATKDDLFHASRLAGVALGLDQKARHVLDHLVGCYGGEQIKSMFLVWPANEFLMERTGLSERAVRYAVRSLVVAGAVRTKDSANGKRFAIRSKSGQIVDAYGFDLSPLLSRRDEFAARVEILKAEARTRRSTFDQITICRRYVQEVLAALDAKLGAAICDEYERLKALTPRRDSAAVVDSLLAMWRALKSHAEDVYNAAFGGTECRLIENNNDAPDQSCQSGREDMGGRGEVAMPDLRKACGDALGYAGDISTMSELHLAAARLRGAFGVHQSAWAEAVDTLGGAAAPAFFVALQYYCLDQRSKAQIKNFGGYFRSLVRKIAGGQVDLKQEIAALQFRRRN